ncbi:MAG: hypothetical protein GY696_06590 [Gammaproteobacteria bacterium]|nr:hypothetical protein [Gammaproteobacteria bacterium]
MSFNLRSGGSLSSGAVSIREDDVIKQVSEGNCAAEVWRSQYAAELGEQTGAFFCPTIIDFTSESITFQRVRGLVPLRSKLNGSTGVNTARAVGRALGMIHSCRMSSVLEPGVKEVPTDYFAVEGCFYHGDYNTYNISYDECGDRLCILDWAPPAWAAGFEFSRRKHFDLCVFILSIYSRRPLEAGVVKAPNLIVDEFLAEYQAVVGSDFGVGDFGRVFSEILPEFARLRRPMLFAASTFLRKPSFWMANKHCSNFVKQHVKK